jgi:ubiquitin carboxyl-terminal hydrolase 5/13
VKIFPLHLSGKTFFYLLASKVASKVISTGPGIYNLRGFISHMGSSPHSGHYVTHVKRNDGKWYIFNDEKV